MVEIDFGKIGRKIREVRNTKRLTQLDLAEEVGVNTSHISNIENNRVKISLTLLVNISNALDVSVDFLLSDEYKEPNSALDHSLFAELQKCPPDMKERLLKIIIALQ